LFTLDYFKHLHIEHVKYAPFTSHYVPELKAKIRLLIPSGEFKLTPNSPTRSDGKLFQFCPPSQVEEQLKLLLSLLKQYQNEHLNPVVLAAWFHAEFIRIHPFVDGNGRVGRLLASKILMEYDLLPMIVEREKRSEYIESMDESITKNNLTSLINFIKREQLIVIEQVRKQTVCEKQKYPLCQLDD
jgi:Fic family protein